MKKSYFKFLLLATGYLSILACKQETKKGSPVITEAQIAQASKSLNE